MILLGVDRFAKQIDIPRAPLKKWGRLLSAPKTPYSQRVSHSTIVLPKGGVVLVEVAVLSNSAFPRGLLSNLAQIQV